MLFESFVVMLLLVELCCVCVEIWMLKCCLFCVMCIIFVMIVDEGFCF